MSEQGSNFQADRSGVPLEYQRRRPRPPVQFIWQRFAIFVFVGAAVVIGYALWLRHLEREFFRLEGSTIVIHSKNPTYWRRVFDISSCEMATSVLCGAYVVACIATVKRRWGYEWIVALLVFVILWLAMGIYWFGISDAVDP